MNGFKFCYIQIEFPKTVSCGPTMMTMKTIWNWTRFMPPIWNESKLIMLSAAFTVYLSLFWIFQSWFRIIIVVLHIYLSCLFLDGFFSSLHSFIHFGERTKFARFSLFYMIRHYFLIDGQWTSIAKSFHNLSKSNRFNQNLWYNGG